MRFSSLRLKASSIIQGKLVAASTITNGSFPPTGPEIEDMPSICIKISDFTLREDSCSSPLPRDEQRESISSIKIVEGE